MSDYPEHDKLAAIQHETQAVGEFLEWLEGQGCLIAKYRKGSHFPWPDNRSITTLLAEWSGVDPNKLEAEKRAMLKGLTGR